MAEANINLNVNSTEASKSIDNINSDLEQTNEELEDVNDNIDDTGKNMKKASKGSKNVSKTFSGWGKALKATGILVLIGAIVKVLGAVKDAVLANATVAETWEQKMSGAKAVFDKIASDGVSKFKDLRDTFQADGGITGLFSKIKDTKLGEWFSDTFSSPKQFIINIGTLVKDQIINRFLAVIETLKFVGKAIGNLAKGNIKEMKENFVDAGKASVDIFTGVKDTIDKVDKATEDLQANAKKYAAELKVVSDAAAALTLREQDLALAKARTAEQIAKNNVLISEQKTLGDDITKTEEERIAALDEALRLEQENLALKQQNAREALNILVAQNALSESGKEDLAAEAKLRTELIQLEADANNKSLEYQNKKNALVAQTAANEIADLKELDRLKAENITNELDRELKLRELDYQDQLIALDDNLEAKKEAEIAYLNDIAAIRGEFALEQKEKDEEVAEELADSRQEEIDGILAKGEIALSVLDSIQVFQDAARQKELDDAQGDAIKIEAINKKYAKKEKTIALSKAVIETALAVTKALSSVPPPLNIPLGIAAGIAGGAQIATIKQQTFSRGGTVLGNGNGTSDSIPALLSSGEVVINANSASRYSDQLSAINVAGGGIPLARGGYAGTSDALSNPFNSDNIIEGVTSGVNNKKTYVLLSDITSGQNDIRTIVEDSEL